MDASNKFPAGLGLIWHQWESQGSSATGHGKESRGIVICGEYFSFRSMTMSIHKVNSRFCMYCKILFYKFIVIIYELFELRVKGFLSFRHDHVSALSISPLTCPSHQHWRHMSLTQSGPSFHSPPQIARYSPCTSRPVNSARKQWLLYIATQLWLYLTQAIHKRPKVRCWSTMLTFFGFKHRGLESGTSHHHLEKTNRSRRPLSWSTSWQLHCCSVGWLVSKQWDLFCLLHRRELPSPTEPPPPSSYPVLPHHLKVSLGNHCSCRSSSSATPSKARSVP